MQSIGLTTYLCDTGPVPVISDWNSCRDCFEASSDLGGTNGPYWNDSAGRFFTIGLNYCNNRFLVQSTTSLSTSIAPGTATSAPASTTTGSVQALNARQASSAPTSFASTTRLEGLITCSSNIINPTYTPPVALPSNYFAGCPPGSVCVSL